MPIKFSYLGVEYEMTPDQIEAAFRFQFRQYRLMDAKRQFLEFAYGCDPEALDRFGCDYQELCFEKEFGFSISVGMQMLDAFVERFEKLFDCNTAENATWRDAIEDVLGEARK